MFSWIGIDWSQKALNFDRFGDILDLFRGGNILFWFTAYPTELIYSTSSKTTFVLPLYGAVNTPFWLLYHDPSLSKTSLKIIGTILLTVVGLVFFLYAANVTPEV